jgi:uncharacterized protein
MTDPLRKLQALRDHLAPLDRVAVAYSGGVDSTLLLAVAVEVLGDRAVGVLAVSASLPRQELADAVQLASQLGAKLEQVATGEVADPAYAANAPNRCFHCKDHVYAALLDFARARSIPHLMDGMNAEDTLDLRPGRAAAKKHGVTSPLHELGFSKAEVRAAARHLGLPNWDKPAAACLSSRIPYGTAVTSDLLARIEAAESFVGSLGFRELRVRHHGDLARVEVPVCDLGEAVAKQSEITGGLKALGWIYVTLDLDGLSQGSMNKPLLAAARNAVSRL